VKEYVYNYSPNDQYHNQQQQQYQQQYDDYFYRLEQRLLELEQEQERIKKENEELKQKVSHIKPIHIENINYKIQELVVKELKGTLNIGLTTLADEKQLNKLIEDQVDGNGEINLQDLDTNQNEQP
jgi:spore germination protein PC